MCKPAGQYVDKVEKPLCNQNDNETPNNNNNAELQMDKILSQMSYFDRTQPWVLVPNGSYMGHFDYVPAVFRVGRWSTIVSFYLLVLSSMVITGGIWYYNEPIQEEKGNYFEAFSKQWYYNLIGFLWISYVSFDILKDMGKFVLSTFTMISWMILNIRHGLGALVPFVPSLARLNESLRFPSLVQATVTFVVWNFLLCPVILSYIKDPEERRKTLKFFFGFRMVNVHLLNIVFAAINGVWGSPARDLLLSDLYVGIAICFIYLLFYLFILDRLGIHFYPVFSPRTLLPLVTWTLTLALYYGSFKMWGKKITEYGTAFA